MKAGVAGVPAGLRTGKAQGNNQPGRGSKRSSSKAPPVSEEELREQERKRIKPAGAKGSRLTTSKQKSANYYVGADVKGRRKRGREAPPS